MEQLLQFIDILAWGTLVICGARSGLTFYGAVSYNSDPARQLHDSIRGVKRSFPWFRRGLPALVAVAWLLAA